MRKHLLALSALLMAVSASAQPLFTYGNDTVTAHRFLAAYHKNNSAAPNNSTAVKDYLRLYIASRLKIKEAKAMGFDTLPQVKADLKDLREQIMPAYLNDDSALERMTEEAFLRSQKDIHVAHIFISFHGQPDSSLALQKAREAQKALKSGEPFAAVAARFSDDPSAKENGGDIGFITVFTLPYELENKVYETPVGQVSSLYTSRGGYHLFKKLEERPALGRIKAAQILLAFPPDEDEETKKELRKRADSLYIRLQKGDPFGRLAQRFSSDAVSAGANGELPSFEVGQYHPLFEKAVLALPVNGTVSAPFMTRHGWHIVKRLGYEPVNKNKNNKEAWEALQQKVQGSDRMAMVRKGAFLRIRELVGIKKEPFSQNELWGYTDSLLQEKRLSFPVSITPQTILVHTGAKKLTAADWITYAQAFRFKEDGTGLKPYEQVWNEFIDAMALEYYKDNLEEYKPEFKAQVEEFKEGNLFFEIMQREVWGKAQSDTAALLRYYHQHTLKYKWKKSADAVLFYAPDKATATQLAGRLKKAPARWKEVASAYADEKVAADSSRFELHQLPVGAAYPLKEGSFTPPLVNKMDNTVSFAYIIKVYPAGRTKTFAEAKGDVVNDYQAVLEKEWITTLEKKYPVVINEGVLATLSR